ncbi:unnamed protein product [Thelazia callipaeda]|uniref:Lipoprotein n=1 Tax=Thelazia callipaeda TaxID=103827 RepID=A0A0N5D620_THECL|nr:unnamed protein product [Thelazia callipaeda]
MTKAAFTGEISVRTRNKWSAVLQGAVSLPVAMATGDCKVAKKNCQSYRGILLFSSLSSRVSPVAAKEA